MRQTHPTVILGVVLALGPAGFAQGKPESRRLGEPERVEPDSKPRPLKKLSEKELDEKLQIFCEGRARKFMPPDLLKKSKSRQRAWLRQFKVSQTKHYVVISSGPPSATRKIKQCLEDLYTFIHSRWPFHDPAEHLPFYVLQNEEQYYDFCVGVTGMSRAEAERTRGHAFAGYCAAYYISPRHEAIPHEASHQIMKVCLEVPEIGSWFHEGFAVYIETRFPKDKPHNWTVKADFKSDRFYSLRQMIRMRSLISDSTHSARNYQHAGSLMAFLVHSDDPRLAGKFADLLRSSRKFRNPMLTAKASDREEVAKRLFKDVYGMTIEQVEAAWIEHYTKPKGKMPLKKKRAPKKR